MPEQNEDIAISPNIDISALQAKAEGLEQQLSARTKELEGQDSDLRALKEQLGLAASKYRSLLLAGNPEIPQELISGSTIAEVETSFQSAREVVLRIKKGLEAKMALDRVPAGAPARSAPDLSQLSPREKIAHALAQR